MSISPYMSPRSPLSINPIGGPSGRVHPARMSRSATDQLSATTIQNTRITLQAKAERHAALLRTQIEQAKQTLSRKQTELDRVEHEIQNMTTTLTPVPQSIFDSCCIL